MQKEKNPLIAIHVKRASSKLTLDSTYKKLANQASLFSLQAVFAHEGERMATAASGLLEVHRLVVLVHDFSAEDFLKHVFQAHDTRDGTEFVDHADHVAALFQETEQQVLERDAVGYQLERAHELAEFYIATPFGQLVVGVAAQHDTDPLVLLVAIQRDSGERPVSAFVERLADGLVCGEAEDDMPRRHHLARRHRLQRENVLDDGRLVLVDDLFAEAQTHEAVDVLDTHFLLLFVLARPVLGERKAEPDDARPAENLGDVEERNRHERGGNLRLLHAERLRGDFAKQQYENRENDREGHRRRGRKALDRERRCKRRAYRIGNRIHHEHRGDIAVDVFLHVHQVARRELLLLAQVLDRRRRDAIERSLRHGAERRYGEARKDCQDDR